MNVLFKGVVLGAALLLAQSGFAAGFDGDYEVFQGDFNQDGSTDIYVREKTPIVLIQLDDIAVPIPKAPHVAPFVLIQNSATRTFTVTTDLAGLHLEVKQPSQIAVIPIDVDLDGQMDAVLKNVGSAVYGADDQIVYTITSTGDTNAVSQVKPIDSSMRAFVAQMTGWFDRSDYFEVTDFANNWYSVQYGSWMWAWWYGHYLGMWGYTVNGSPIVALNEDPYVRDPAPASCTRGDEPCRFTNGEWQMYGYAQERTITFDYSHFDSRALSLSGYLSQPRANGALVAGSADATSASSILSQVFGRPILGGVLQNSQASLPYENGWPSDWVTERRLFAIENMMASLNDAITQPVPTQKPAFQKLDGVNVTVKEVPGLGRGSLTKVHAIVLHRTGSTNVDGGINTAKTTKIGVHFYIGRDGTIYQTASLDKFTKHVGYILSRCIQEPNTCTSTELADAKAAATTVENRHNFERKKAYPKRYPMSEDSVGIEVASTLVCTNKPLCTQSIVGDITDAQKQAISTLVEALKQKYGLANTDIYHHDTVSQKTAGEGSGLGY